MGALECPGGSRAVGPAMHGQKWPIKSDLRFLTVVTAYLEERNAGASLLTPLMLGKEYRSVALHCPWRIV
jgi:hypothetical protein